MCLLHYGAWPNLFVTMHELLHWLCTWTHSVYSQTCAVIALFELSLMHTVYMQVIENILGQIVTSQELLQH